MYVSILGVDLNRLYLERGVQETPTTPTNSILQNTFSWEIGDYKSPRREAETTQELAKQII